VLRAGSISNLAPQATAGDMSIGLSSSLAPGFHSESATIEFTSVAVIGSGLANTTTSRSVAVVGKVYEPATGSAAAELNLGTQRLGASFPDQTSGSREYGHLG